MLEQSGILRSSCRCLKERVVFKNTQLWPNANSDEVKSDLPFALSGSGVMLALKTSGNIAVKVNIPFIESL